jgi:hypothetical protein
MSLHIHKNFWRLLLSFADVLEFCALVSLLLSPRDKQTSDQKDGELPQVERHLHVIQNPGTESQFLFPAVFSVGSARKPFSHILRTRKPSTKVVVFPFRMEF